MIFYMSFDKNHWTLDASKTGTSTDKVSLVTIYGVFVRNNARLEARRRRIKLLAHSPNICQALAQLVPNIFQFSFTVYALYRPNHPAKRFTVHGLNVCIDLVFCSCKCVCLSLMDAGLYEREAGAETTERILRNDSCSLAFDGPLKCT